MWQHKNKRLGAHCQRAPGMHYSSSVIASFPYLSTQPSQNEVNISTGYSLVAIYGDDALLFTHESNIDWNNPGTVILL